MSNPDADGDNSRLEVLYGRNGLKVNAENTVELVLGISAPNVLSDGTRGTVFEVGDGPMATAEEYEQALAHAATLAFRDVQLMLTLAPGVSAEVIGAVRLSDRTWRIPDMAWGAKTWVPMRMLVPAAVASRLGEQLRLARVKVQASFVSDRGTQILGTQIHMPVLAYEEFQDLPVNEFVLDRVRDAG